MENPIAHCQICNGPIGQGEPVSIRLFNDPGKEPEYTHRFKPTCDWHKEQEAIFAASLGILFDDPRPQIYEIPQHEIDASIQYLEV